MGSTPSASGLSRVHRHRSIRTALITILLAGAALTLVAWTLGNACQDRDNSYYDREDDCAWGSWIATTNCGIIGQHARIPLGGGYRLYVKAARHNLSAALVSPYDWTPAFTARKHELGGFLVENSSYKIPTNPAYWDMFSCRDKGTYDDRFIIVQVPAWFPLIVFLVYPSLVLVFRPARAHLRRRRSQCGQCGYQITPRTSAVCPECGHPGISVRAQKQDPAGRG
jgi:predicted RNA-binding Zn-ribbon protein involved in translation (DUF1610 family)